MTKRTPTHSARASTALAAVLLGLVFFGLQSLGALPAFPHSWYTGKTDPVTGVSCCGGADCAEIPDTDVKSVDGGYVYLPTGEFIENARAQQAHDWQFHRCVFLSGDKKGLTRCFFVPGRSM